MNTPPTNDVAIAELRVEMRHLSDAVANLTTDVKDLTATLNQARGGWKAVAALSGLGGTIAGAVASIIANKLGS